MRAAVAGGTGLVGSALLRLLSDAGVETVAVARRPGPELPHVQWRVTDLARLDASALPATTDAAFCCLGTTRRAAGSAEAFRAVDHGMAVRFAAACRRVGVEQFHLVSALGAHPGSRLLYSRTKGEAERDVAALAFPVLRVYRPSLLAGRRAEARSGERLALLAARALGPVLPRRLRAVGANTVARAMLREAQEGLPGTQVLDSAAIARRGR